MEFRSPVPSMNGAEPEQKKCTRQNQTNAGWFWNNLKFHYLSVEHGITGEACARFCDKAIEADSECPDACEIERRESKRADQHRTDVGKKTALINLIVWQPKKGAKGSSTPSPVPFGKLPVNIQATSAIPGSTFHQKVAANQAAKGDDTAFMHSGSLFNVPAVRPAMASLSIGLTLGTLRPS